MLTVYCSSNFLNERKYILDIVFKNILGITYNIEFVELDQVWVLSLDKFNIVLPDILFQTPVSRWLTSKSLPSQPLEIWDSRRIFPALKLVNPLIPIIYGDVECNRFKLKEHPLRGFSTTAEDLFLPIDIFGSSFFMLTRYEEAVKTKRDRHNRFLASSSLAFQEGFLERPIINEYIEILWKALKQFSPNLKRKRRNFRTLVSCDCDHPYLGGLKNFTTQVRQAGGVLIKEKRPIKAIRRAYDYLTSTVLGLPFDKHYQAFEWMMNVNEAAGNKVAFYFFSDQSDPRMDSSYTLGESSIQVLMRNIYKRGHEIGLHASYNTYLDREQTVKESINIQNCFELLNIDQLELGSRQHYLRWQTSDTARNLEAAGINYDTSLTFADHVGFRCGVCFEYPMFDFRERKQLSLRQRPLIVMEGSVFGQGYMGLNYDNDSLSLLLELKKRCKQFDGDFTMLWHNSYFKCIDDKIFYKELIR